ncbi:hypothetical protein pb186bvf_011804 [Paramecium bursaria]
MVILLSQLISSLINQIRYISFYFLQSFLQKFFIIRIERLIDYVHKKIKSIFEKMSEDGNFSLHSFQAEDEDEEIDDFYKQLSLQFYAQEKNRKQKVSLLMSGSTEPNSKPSRDTLPEVKGHNKINKDSRPPSIRGQRFYSKSPPKITDKSNKANQQAQKLIKLLQSPYSQKPIQNQKQQYIQKQLDKIRKLQLQELKEHYYK